MPAAERVSRKSLPSRLVERLSIDVGELLGCQGGVHISRVWMRRHPYSCVFRADFATSQRPITLYLKSVDSLEAPLKQLRWAERFQAEFDILARLWPVFGDERPAGVVQPLNYYPEFSTLATFGVPGIGLRRFLRQRMSALQTNPQVFSDAAHYVSLSGDWLKQFQELTVAANRPFNVDELLEYCEDRLQMLQGNRRNSIEGRLATQVLDRLSVAAGQASVAHTAMAGCHGDFMHHNIIVHEGRMRVLDFTMYEENSAFYDPCSFWSELEFMKVRFGVGHVQISQLQAMFLDAFGRVMPDDPLFRAIHVRYLLVALCKTVESSRAGLLSVVDSWRMARAYRDRLQKFAVTGI